MGREHERRWRDVLLHAGRRTAAVSDGACAEIHVIIRDESDLVTARRHVRELAAQQGLAEVAIAALATAVTEVASNLVVHAGGGEIRVAPARDARRRGVIVTALDAGPGIRDIDLAM